MLPTTAYLGAQYLYYHSPFRVSLSLGLSTPAALYFTSFVRPFISPTNEWSLSIYLLTSPTNKLFGRTYLTIENDLTASFF